VITAEQLNLIPAAHRRTIARWLAESAVQRSQPSIVFTPEQRRTSSEALFGAAVDILDPLDEDHRGVADANHTIARLLAEPDMQPAVADEPPGLVIDELVKAAGTVLLLGRRNRTTMHEDGIRRESVTDHTVMLTLIATALAARWYPDLDLGKIALYAAVHDLVEAYADDTCTLRGLDAQQQQDKEQREALAYQRIRKDLGRHLGLIPDLIIAYEAQDDLESRWVKNVDKALPKLAHIRNGGATIQNSGATSAELSERYRKQNEEMAARTPEFPLLIGLHAILAGRVIPMADGTPALTAARFVDRARRRDAFRWTPSVDSARPDVEDRAGHTWFVDEDALDGDGVVLAHRHADGDSVYATFSARDGGHFDLIEVVCEPCRDQARRIMAAQMSAPTTNAELYADAEAALASLAAFNERHPHVD
jgi:5'-deoxynucleotidase YfbR-like HD superfamily hydrolase